MNETSIPDGYVRVTQILEPFSKLTHIDQNVLAMAADRGTRVHAYCEAYALDLFVDQVDDDCKNYFEVFKKWFDKYVQSVLKTETRMNYEPLKISGQCDMIAILKGDELPTIIDIKTPLQPSKSWQLQTAAYKFMAQEIHSMDIERRICLMLPKTGSEVKIVEHTDYENDLELFLNALKLYRFFQ